METQGIVIWARGGTGALIVWCADNGALVYVADRSQAGDANGALCVGDFVDLRVDTLGAMRVGRELRYRGAGAAWVSGALARDAQRRWGPVMSRDAALEGAIVHGAAGRLPVAANRRRNSGAA